MARRQHLGLLWNVFSLPPLRQAAPSARLPFWESCAGLSFLFCGLDPTHASSLWPSTSLRWAPRKFLTMFRSLTPHLISFSRANPPFPKPQAFHWSNLHPSFFLHILPPLSLIAHNLHCHFFFQMFPLLSSLSYPFSQNSSGVAKALSKTFFLVFPMFKFLSARPRGSVLDMILRTSIAVAPSCKCLLAFQSRRKLAAFVDAESLSRSKFWSLIFFFSVVS